MQGLAEVRENSCTQLHGTEAPALETPPVLAPASLCLPTYLFAFKYLWEASRHSNINVSLGSVGAFKAN